jgi:hypothetical protein
VKDVKRFTQVNHSLWGKVKDYVTVENLTIYSAVELVLRETIIIVCRRLLATEPGLEVLPREPGRLLIKIDQEPSL